MRKLLPADLQRPPQAGAAPGGPALREGAEPSGPVQREVKLTPAQRHARRKSIKPGDPPLTVIAKLGGFNREAVISEWGIDPADIDKLPRPVFGTPVVRKTGGLSPDGMGEMLAQEGLIPVDQNGKWDVRVVEEYFQNALRGPQTTGADPQGETWQPELPPEILAAEGYTDLDSVEQEQASKIDFAIASLDRDLPADPLEGLLAIGFNSIRI